MLDSIDNKNLNSESLKNEEVLDNMIVTDPTEISKNKKKLKLNRIQLFTLYFFLFAFIGSRIVAMSFCEARSWKAELSS